MTAPGAAKSKGETPAGERPVVTGRRLLVVFAAEAAVVTVLTVSGALPAWAGVHHHVALPPFDQFADVRLLVARAPGWPAFVAGVVLVGAARTAVLAYAVGRRRAGLVYAVATPVAIVAGVLAYAGAALLYSVFVWIGAALVVVAGTALAPWPWPTPRPRRAVAAAAGFVVVLLVLSAVAATASTSGRVALVWATAGAAIVAVQLATGAGGRATPRAPAGAGAALVLVLTVVPASPPVATVRPVPRTGSLFLVPGVGAASGAATMFRLDPAALGFTCEQTYYFSYAGPGDGAQQHDAACPIRTGAPYASDDTRRPFAPLVATFRAQVADLPGPVVVVAHSQGTWIAVAALAGSPVEALAMLAPFPEHPWGYDGEVGTAGMRALVALLRGSGVTRFDPDAPLPTQMMGTPGRIDEVMAATPRAAGLAFAVSSAFDLPLMSGGGRVPGAADACPVPVHHGSLPTSDRSVGLVARFLDGEDLSGCPWWRRFPYRAGAAFTVPP